MSTRISASKVTHCLVVALTFTLLVLCASLLRSAAADVAPSQVWVDDNYCSGCPNDGHTWGVDAFATIQDGINAVAAGGTVHVAAGLYAEHLTIGRAMTIEGAGQADTILDASGTGRAVQVMTASVAISGLTIQHGSAPDEGGGAIASSGALTLTQCTVMLSHAAAGGAIHVKGTALLDGCQILTNTAQYSGGGIYNEGTVMLMDTALISNTAPYGGGLDNLGDALLDNCTVRLNVAPGASSAGGGLLNEPGATMSVAGGTVSGNGVDYAGGGIYNSEGGTLYVTDCAFGANGPSEQHASIYGGAALHNEGLATVIRGDFLAWAGHTIHNVGTMSIRASRIHSSYYYQATGLYNSGLLTVTDSVIETFGGYYPQAVTNSGGKVTITRSRLSNLSGGKYDYVVCCGAITITHSTLERNDEIRASMVAHSWITNNATIRAPTILGNDFLGWYGASGTAVYLNNYNGQYTSWPGVSVLTDTVVTERVTDGTLDARATSAIEVDVTGTTTLFLGRLAGTPGGARAFVPIAGGFFDVYQKDPSGLTQVTIRFYYPQGPEESVLGLWWWDGSVWRRCSDQGIDTTDLPGYGGYLWARLTDSTVPALNEWSGGHFAAGEGWWVLQQGLEGYTGGEDTHLYQYEPTTNYCREPWFTVGYRQQNVGLLRFELPPMPDDRVVSEATLQVFAHGWSGADLSMGVYVVSRTVEVCEATWAQARAGDNWGSGGGNDIATDRRPDPESTVTTSGNRQWYSLDVSAAVQAWSQGKLANNGLLLREMTPSENSFLLASAEYDTLEYRPRLIVKWRRLGPILPGDLDGDCDVDIVDIMMVASRWGTQPGDPRYDARYDLDSDGDIDIVDIMLVAVHWGTVCG